MTQYTDADVFIVLKNVDMKLTSSSGLSENYLLSKPPDCRFPVGVPIGALLPIHLSNFIVIRLFNLASSRLTRSCDTTCYRKLLDPLPGTLSVEHGMVLDTMAYVISQAWQCKLVNMMTSSNGNIFRFTGHLCGEFTDSWWIPSTKSSDAELWCFLWSASE